MKTLDRLAIVVRDDSWDRLLTPLAFAWEAAKKGARVDMLFVLWSVRLLTARGSDEHSRRPRDERDQWLADPLVRDDEPTEIRDYLTALHRTGRVRLHACRLAAGTFDVAEDDLLPESAGIIDPGDFLREIALEADHTQYF